MTRNKPLRLTLFGDGAFGNDQGWIIDAIRRSAELVNRFDFDVKIVGFRHSNAAVRELCESRCQ